MTPEERRKKVADALNKEFDYLGALEVTQNLIEAPNDSPISEMSHDINRQLHSMGCDTKGKVKSLENIFKANKDVEA
jgi:hypothetical protein